MTWVHLPCAHWTSSLALEGAYSQEPSSAGRQSAPSRSTPTASGSLSNGNVMGSSRPSPSGMTCGHFPGSPGEGMSISSREDFPVRTSPSLGRVQGFLGVAAAYGQSSPASLGKYDPATHSLRTPQCSLLGDSHESLQILPRWGWMHAGVVSGLMTSERPISASDSGYSLPTPSSVSYGSNQGGGGGRLGPVRESLETMARRNTWPTPNVPNGGRTTWHAEQEGNSFYHNGKKVQLDLAQAVRIWATPSARDWRSGKASEATHAKNSRPLSEQVGGTLNPTWTEWLLGWPCGWTDLLPLSPLILQEWLHGNASQGTSDQDMRTMREGDDPTSMAQRETRFDLQAETILQSQMCGTEGNDQQELGKKAGTANNSSSRVCPMRDDKGITTASQGSRCPEQSPWQYRSSLSALSHAGTSEGPDMGTWWQVEPDIPRVANGVSNRVHRLRAIGNGWVPQCAVAAWHILTSGRGEHE